MTNLSLFKKDGLEIVIDLLDGAAYCTQAGYLRMSTKAKATISERMNKPVWSERIKSDEILTEQGLQRVRLVPAELAFSWLVDDNPELAKKMGTVGATVYLHQQAGYKVTSTAIQPQPEPAPQAPCMSTIAMEAAALAEFVARVAGCQPSMAAQLAVNAAVAVNPSLTPAKDELKVAIACTATEEDALLNPTQIGKMLKISNQAVNKALIEKGLQYKTEEKKFPYRPTEIGKEFGSMVPSVARQNEEAVYQLRWRPTVVKILETN